MKVRSTCIELIVSQCVVVDARSLACEDCISERTLVQMSRERPRAARAITHTKEETFNRSDQNPLLTSMRAAASTVDETEDGQIVIFSGKGDGEALRGDGSGHWGYRVGVRAKCCGHEDKEKSSELANSKVLDFGSGRLLEHSNATLYSPYRWLWPVGTSRRWGSTVACGGTPSVPTIRFR